ncbi:MAG: carbohydrate kinase family protein [Spirochaetes bacterium]|nr:carbohydrate kinase family protein [Spirochaetota bacterium]
MAGIDIIGNLNMDLVIRGLPGMPAWGQEVIGDDCILLPSGQAGYTSFALRRLGIPVRLVANVGDDPWGSSIREALAAAGVDCRGVEARKGSHTGISVACVRDDGERAFVSYYGCLMEFDGDMIRRNRGFIPSPDILAFCGLNTFPNLSPLHVEEIFRETRLRGGETVLDTGWDPLGWKEPRIGELRHLLSEVSVFIPNIDEAKAITGRESADEAAKALLDYGAGLVVVKLGAQGSMALGAGICESIPALPVRVFDAVGAGDVYNAGFMTGMLRGDGLRDRMIFGSAAASLYISRDRDRFPSNHEVVRAAIPYLIATHDDEEAT